ncbi:MAG: branched-chain-amino-acid transaminase [Methylacidiphilales bacterium]|nr:branched-chain-amino-acid transaminase [Candidatus Methylacidiphilales bacterium]MDW8350155.1 branched-chain-amino-acid transaminase [Verrucomicrobiae bacterium]
MQIYIDGQYYSKEDAKISVFDHGLLYGDGVFEGIRVYNRKVFQLTEHLLRLQDSARALMLKLPLTLNEIEEAILECCRRNNLQDGYIRLVVTRGVGNLGLSPDKCTRATIIIIAGSIELYPEKYYREGLKVVTVPTWRNSPAALSPAIKSLNYLNNIMAKIEGTLCGAQESIMLNSEGYVTECSGDNIFIRKGERIYTPPIYAGALDGITHRVVMELVKQSGSQVEEKMLTRYDLFVADEMFLTGTGAEIVPVVEVDGRIIGDGKPGRLTQSLMAAYREYAHQHGTPF